MSETKVFEGALYAGQFDEFVVSVRLLSNGMAEIITEPGMTKPIFVEARGTGTVRLRMPMAASNMSYAPLPLTVTRSGS
jgi:hypothetical protein